ncbi:MAG: PDZ domain-containing protein [Dysgonamonadaceae bacterium]|nr:PDZ domain-containing protein [Dysgonamonadaceae bacterium]
MNKVFFSLIMSVLFCSCSYGQRNSNDQNMRKLQMTLYAIQNLYVDTVNESKLVEDAVIGLLEKLDPHSVYLNPEEVKEMNEPLQGNFDGIGIQFNMLTDTLYVIQVISGGPSEKVGIYPGDRIMMVNDTLIAGVKMKTNDVMRRLKGPKGTTVGVKVLRQGVSGLIEFKIIRDKIPVYSLDAHYMINKKTGYICLNRFAATSHDEFMKAFKSLRSQGMENLIFDLQGNGGGYLVSAIDIADEFLKQGETIVYTEGEHQRREDARATAKGDFEKGNLVILVDEYSASASEIVSGAIQDWDRGVIVGRRSFGKGLVQRPIPLSDGSMIRLTTARYYTPTGRSIQKPYENGNLESYNKDLIDRYNHGEMLSADSIHFPDSLKYSTLINKRTVYGGGGIMPDYFVPLDTTIYATKVWREINGKGLTYRYAISLIDKNRDTYKKEYKNFNDFKSKFTITESMLQDVFKMMVDDRKNVEPDAKDTEATDKDREEFQIAKSLIALQIKGLIARDLWDMNEFRQIINDRNETLKKALEIIENQEEYDKLISGK